MLEEIGSKTAWGYLDEAIASKRKIMGFGHREYKVKDPRATILQGLAETLFSRFGHDRMYDVARRLESLAAEKLGPRHLPECGFLFRAGVSQARHPHRSVHAGLCALRAAGWLAHWKEQLGATGFTGQLRFIRASKPVAGFLLSREAGTMASRLVGCLNGLR